MKLTMRNRLIAAASCAIAAVLLTTSAAIATGLTWPATRELEGLHAWELRDAPTGTPFAGWQLLGSTLLHGPVVAIGTPVAAGDGSAETVIAMLKQAGGDDAEFVVASDRVVGSLRRIHYGEQRAGLPVICGRADATLNQRGEIMRWGLRSHASFPVRDKHLLDMASCAEQFPRFSGERGWVVERSSAAWFPDDERRDLIPVYWVRIAGTLPEERWEGIVSAVSGEILLEWPGIAEETVSGTVTGPYWQPYIQSPVQFAGFAHSTVYVDSASTITDMDGGYSIDRPSPEWISARLHGPYVAAENEDAPPGDLHRNLSPPYAPTNLQWSTGEAAAPELNLFYHTTLIHDWYKVLDSAFDALDYPMPAVANVGSGYDNAFWNGYGTYYGSGSTYQNFAMFSDVIYHEYTHGVTDGIYPDGMLPYIDQPGALNEAWSDYIACSINGDPLMGEYLLPNNPYSAFRDLENDLVFPQNWQGEVHADSRFVSGALWRIRAAMGLEFTDALAHFARYGLAETFLDYLISVLETDDDDGNLANGTPHSTLIYNSFGIHGIGPGDRPQFEIRELSYVADGSGGSIGNGNRYMEQGETVALNFTLANAAPLYPPPAENVDVQVMTADESVTIVNGSQTIPVLPAGAQQALATVLLQIAPGGADRWLELTIHITANGGAVTFDHAFEFTIGRPHILIVSDDPNTNVEHFVVDAIRAQGRVFERVEPTGDHAVGPEFFPLTGMVVWLSGNQSGSIITEEDQDRLEQFMTAGNKVVLSGQNIVDDLAGSDFATRVLGVEITTDSLLSNAVTVWDTPLPIGAWYLITGSRGAANQRQVSALTPTGDSRLVGRYSRTPNGPGAILEFGSGNGLLFGFGIEAVSGMATGSAPVEELLTSLYEWAGPLLDAPGEVRRATVPEQLAVQAVYPNPFNSVTSLVYAVPERQLASLQFFDVLGRLVETHTLTGSGAYQWNPQVSSGIYFARLKSEHEVSPAVKLMLMK
ncbi:T9SS type A sorting domain-containing protein [candidate division KSB1 bacterium]|nr:T9SS type A sorting domain-containing protein [candidate division KSB1 bacterium]